MYVGGLLNNLEQHANIDHNNDVDNHVNLATMEHTKNPSIYLWKLTSSEHRYDYNSGIY
jgi:hypothetical protein